MASSSCSADRAGGKIARLILSAGLTAIAAYVILAAWKAVISPLKIDDFPESLAVKAELMPTIFPLHMVSGGLALVLVPLAMVLSPWPRWHRPVARIAALDVLVAALSAFPVALVAPVFPLSAAGFAAQGALWLTFLVLGIRAIRRGDRQRHRACMALMAAVTSGALFFRIYLALWAIFAHGRFYEAFYVCDSWIAWGLPLAFTAWWQKRDGNRKGRKIPA